MGGQVHPTDRAHLVGAHARRKNVLRRVALSTRADLFSGRGNRNEVNGETDDQGQVSPARQVNVDRIPDVSKPYPVSLLPVTLPARTISSRPQTKSRAAPPNWTFGALPL